MASIEPGCMRIVVEKNVADILIDYPNGLHVEQLAEKTGLNKGKIARIMRLLATRHCFREGEADFNYFVVYMNSHSLLPVSPNIFTNNRLSLQILQSNDMSSLVSVLSNETGKASSYLYESISDPLSGSGDSENPTEAPLLYALRKNKDVNVQGAYFDWYLPNVCHG
jgi:hypothetical protein